MATMAEIIKEVQKQDSDWYEEIGDAVEKGIRDFAGLLLDGGHIRIVYNKDVTFARLQSCGLLQLYLIRRFDCVVYVIPHSEKKDGDWFTILLAQKGREIRIQIGIPSQDTNRYPFS